MKILNVTLGLMVVLSLVAFAQGPDREPDRERLYTTTIGEDAGRIIINGRLLEPPYEIYATKDTIKINEIIIQSRDPEPEPYTVDSNSSFEEKRNYKLFHTPYDSFAVWCEQFGSDSAMKLIEQLYKSFEEVDTVYGYIGWALSLEVKHRDFPETVEFQPPLSEGHQIEQISYHDSVLIKEAFSFERAVRNKKLLIITGPGDHYQSNAIEQVALIEEVLDSQSLTYQDKLDSLKAIVRNKKCAEQILDNWEN